MRSVAPIALALLLYGTATASGQLPAAMQEGARVRIVVVGGGRSTGVVDRVSSDSVVLRREGLLGHQKRFAFESIESLELSVSKHREVLSTALKTTGLLSLGFGVFFAVAYAPSHAGFPDPGSRAEAACIGLAVGAAVGAPIGILSGLVNKRETWETVPLPAHSGWKPSVSVLPSVHGRVALGITLPVGH